MAFARRTPVTSTSSSNGHGYTQTSSNSNTGHHGGPSFSDDSNVSTDSHSGSIIKRVSTMFTPRKKSQQDTFGKPLASIGIGYEVPQPRKMGWKIEKRSKARRSSVLTFRGSSDSEVEDLDDIRQPNDLGPPAPSIYSSVPEEDEQDPNPATPKKPTQQKIQRRFSMQSIQSLLSTQQPSDSSFSMVSKVYTRRSVNPSLHSKTSSFHSRTYSHSLHSLSQSLLEEEAELVQENPVFIATKGTKVSAVWAGPSRTTSAPNLVSVLPQNPPTFTLNVRRKPPPRLGLRELPQRVLARVFGLLPRRLLLGLASLSKNFCYAARIVIYGTLDLRNMSAIRQNKLNMFLSRRTDLTELTQVLICGATSSLHLPTFPSALVLSHMNHLTTITLPYFSIDFMQHHTAFGLRSVTFLNTDLTPVEKVELFNWLDGQVNITTLSFPRLFDSHAEKDQLMLLPTYINTRFPLAPPTANSLLAFPLSSPPSSPSLAPPSSFAVPLPPSPLSPSSVNFPPEVNLILATLSKSSTLLPHLETVCAPPSLLQLLAPYRAGTLKEVGMNINDTLVGGLRPAELIGVLKPSDEANSNTDQGGENKGDNKFLPGPEILHLNFGKSVDRRTIEKVLGAAGAVLGSFPSVGLTNTGVGRRDQEEKRIDSVDSPGGPPSEEDPPGLHHLEIAVPFNGPRTEEILHKTIHSVLPRYRALCTLVMRLSTPSEMEEMHSPVLPEADVPTVVDESSPGISISLPSVEVNDADQTVSLKGNHHSSVNSDDYDPLLSPTDTFENSVESEPQKSQNCHSPTKTRWQISHASSSQLSLASGGTVPSVGSIVSLTMFPEPPSTVPTTDDVTKVFPSAAAIFSDRIPESPTLPISKPKTLRARLPSLKKRSKRAETAPPSPLPKIVTLSPTERSATLPLTPTLTPYGSPSTAVPPPLTPTTPRIPSTPSTPRYSQSLQAHQSSSDRFDDDLPSQRWERRVSSMTTTSGLSVSSSIRGVDWNHDGNGESANGNSEPSTPAVPEMSTTTEDIPETTVLSDNEKKHVRMWIRQCPTLRRVVFISGAEWGL